MVVVVVDVVVVVAMAVADEDHSGHGHGHGDVYGHVHPSSPCQARDLALEHGLRLGVPQRRCACRGIRENEVTPASIQFMISMALPVG